MTPKPVTRRPGSMPRMRTTPADRVRSMPEMAHAGEHHRDAALVGGGDDLVVAHRAARLDDGRRADVGDDVEAVAERKERVGGDDRPGEVEPRVARLDRSDARGVDAAHLAGPDAERGTVAAEDDRVRLHEFRDAPGEEQVAA